ncbi:hypothetical protein Tco_1262974 [Tanacetum coccineum]
MTSASAGVQYDQEEGVAIPVPERVAVVSCVVEDRITQEGERLSNKSPNMIRLKKEGFSIEIRNEIIASICSGGVVVNKRLGNGTADLVACKRATQKMHPKISERQGALRGRSNCTCVINFRATRMIRLCEGPLKIKTGDRRRRGGAMQPDGRGVSSLLPAETCALGSKHLRIRRLHLLDMKAMQDNVKAGLIPFKTDQEILDEIIPSDNRQNMSGMGRKLPGGGSTSRRRANRAFGDVMTRDQITQMFRQQEQEKELLRKQAEEA